MNAYFPLSLHHPIEGETGSAMHVIDFDGDGDVDILSAGNKLLWHENSDGKGTFGPAKVLNEQGGNTITTADLDGDGDLDVITSTRLPDEISWAENLDGNGTLGMNRVIDIEASRVTDLSASDLNGDGRADVLASLATEHRIVWYENIPLFGDMAFSPRKVITDRAASVRTVHATDVDGDQDIDVFSPSYGGNRDFGWMENIDGKGTFGEGHVFNSFALGVRSVFTADLDGDGDVDVLSGSDYSMEWYENINGLGTFDRPKLITEAIGIDSVFADDLDGDGDLDLLAGSLGEDRVWWYENVDGQGSFTKRQEIRKSNPNTVLAADVDNDGDADILSVSNGGGIVWYENRDVGDANNDGQFDRLDIVQLLQKGEYEDDMAGNSTFDEGDWNGDGDFTVDDLVLALQLDCYVK